MRTMEGMQASSRLPDTDIAAVHLCASFQSIPHRTAGSQFYIHFVKIKLSMLSSAICLDEHELRCIDLLLENIQGATEKWHWL